MHAGGLRLHRDATGDLALPTVPADGSIATIPANLGFVDVAPGTEGAHYALAFVTKGKIHEGQDVLV